MPQATGTPNPAELDILPVEHLPEYIAGFPVYIAITVRAHPNIAFNALPFADFLNLRSCIGAEIFGRAGSEPLRYMPKPYIDPQSGRRGGRLTAGQSRRMLVDVSPYFAAVSPGTYQVRFSYIETDGVYTAAPVMLRFREPTAAEAALLASAAGDRADFGSWGEWTMTCPTRLYEGPIAADNPLRFNLLLRRLFCGAEPPERLDPAALNVLTGLYAPEGNALRAELYRARGDDAGYQALRSRILQETPGLEWWVRMIDGGGAFVKSIRLVP